MSEIEKIMTVFFKDNPQKLEVCEPHIYIMKLKKTLKQMMNRKLGLVEKIYVQFDKTTMIPETVELHYKDEELEDEYSPKGSKILHRIYNFPKNPLRFHTKLDADSDKLVLIYNNWTCKWNVNECKLIDVKGATKRQGRSPTKSKGVF